MDLLLVGLLLVGFLWIGGSMFLQFRIQEKQWAYKRRFPPFKHYLTQERYTRVGMLRVALRRQRDTVWHRQDDPEMEQIRRGVVRSYGLWLLWQLGVPFLTFGTFWLFWPR